MVGIELVIVIFAEKVLKRGISVESYPKYWAKGTTVTPSIGVFVVFGNIEDKNPSFPF